MDARFVVDKRQLNYVSLNQYGAHGWPTWVVLDGEGVIRYVQVGHSPTPRQVFGSRIRELLGDQRD